MKKIILIGILGLVLLSGCTEQLPLPAPSTDSPFELCDLDYDLDCDDEDIELFESFLGTCLETGDPAVKAQTDVDSDNCITEQDRILLFGREANLDCYQEYKEKYPETYLLGETECRLTKDECPCWDGVFGICIPQRHCI